MVHNSCRPISASRMCARVRSGPTVKLMLSAVGTGPSGKVSTVLAARLICPTTSSFRRITASLIVNRPVAMPRASAESSHGPGSKRPMAASIGSDRSQVSTCSMVAASKMST